MPEGIIVHIRKSKTDQEGEGHQVAVPRGSELKPVEALEAGSAPPAWKPVRSSVNPKGRICKPGPPLRGLSR